MHNREETFLRPNPQAASNAARMTNGDGFLTTKHEWTTNKRKAAEAVDQHLRLERKREALFSNSGASALP